MFISKDRMAPTVRSLVVHRLLRDLPSRRGLRPLSLHIAVLMRRACVDPAIIDDGVLAAMAGDVQPYWGRPL
jgi:hypothetical protein